MYLQVGLRCPRCQDVIYSNSRHDWEKCLCGALFIDGGWEYMRWGGAGDGSNPLTAEQFRSLERVTREVPVRKDQPFYYSDEKERKDALIASGGK